MNETLPIKIIPKQYPQLALLCWDRELLEPISEHEALELYQARWDYIDENDFSDEEKIFLKKLMNQFNNGNLYV